MYESFTYETFTYAQVRQPEHTYMNLTMVLTDGSEILTRQSESTHISDSTVRSVKNSDLPVSFIPLIVTAKSELLTR